MYLCHEVQYKNDTAFLIFYFRHEDCEFEEYHVAAEDIWFDALVKAYDDNLKSDTTNWKEEGF